jgi:short subunit fatty acids transporter
MGAFAVFLIVTTVSIHSSYQTKYKLTALSLAKENKRRFPMVEIVSGLVAAIAWGLAMPGSALNTTLSGNDGAIAAAAIVIGGATVLSLLTPVLTTGSTPPTQDHSDGPGQ